MKEKKSRRISAEEKPETGGKKRNKMREMGEMGQTVMEMMGITDSNGSGELSSNFLLIPMNI
jgi:hypothetical protein